MVRFLVALVLLVVVVAGVVLRRRRAAASALRPEDANLNFISYAEARRDFPPEAWEQLPVADEAAGRRAAAEIEARQRRAIGAEFR